MRKKFTFIIAVMLAVASLAGCGGKEPAAASASAPAAYMDREGNEITRPARVDRIVSLSQAATQTLIHLGLSDRLVAVDSYSALLPGLPEGLPQLDMLSPDIETLITVNADLLICSGMLGYDGGDPLKPLRDAGICVAAIPSSSSVAGIMEDLAFIADLVGRKEKGGEIIDELTREIQAVKDLVASSPKKAVYFEIAAAPAAYSFGKNTFLNEMIEIAGGENIFAEADGWLAVSEEQVIARNPDFIFTNVNYLPDPVGEILSRASLKNVAAVKEGRVYQVDNYESSLPNEYIIGAIRRMAMLMHEDIWQD